MEFEDLVLFGNVYWFTDDNIPKFSKGHFITQKIFLIGSHFSVSLNWFQACRGTWNQNCCDSKYHDRGSRKLTYLIIDFE